MNQIILFFRSLSSDTFKLPAYKTSTVKQLKEALARKKNLGDLGFDCIKLMFKGKEILDDQIIQELSIHDGDLIIFMITRKQQVKDKIDSLQKNGEEFKMAVENLIQLGFQREDVIASLKQTNRNFKKTLQHLVFVKYIFKQLFYLIIRKKADKKKYHPISMEEEDQLEHQNKDEQLQEIMIQKKETLKNDPLIQNLIQATQNSPEVWQETLNQISQSNPHIFNDILENYQEFMQEIKNKIQDQNALSQQIILDQDDSIIIEKIKQIGLNITDQKIIQCYLENNKNALQTISQLQQIYKN